MSTAHLLTGAAYRDSLRRYQPRVFVDGRRVETVADEHAFAPGIAAIGVTYDLAHEPEHARLMTARQSAAGRLINRMLHVDTSSDDLLAKLEAVRLLCRQVGCAQRYLAHDALAALYQATWRASARTGGEQHPRFLAYLQRVQAEDLTLAIAMTDAKGDRAKRPAAQSNPRAYVRIKQRRPEGLVLTGTKAIVTAAPYVHEILVMPSRAMQHGEENFAVCCAVPVDAPGLTIIARPAGRPGEPAARFSARYGQSTAVVDFEDVLVPWDQVFLAGEVEDAAFATTTYATHHRHSCIAARAGFGDLLIGASAAMIEANGLDPDRHPHIRDSMVELITIVEGFFACGVAASVYPLADPSGTVVPEPVFANIGKLLLATRIYDMHRLAHTVSGGLIVALPGPDEDHNPATAATLADVFQARADIPATHRREVARLMEDLTASHQAGWYSIISLHGGGSPEAMKREIWRHYPLADRRQLVAELIDRGVAAGPASPDRQPGRCCAEGCKPPAPASESTQPPLTSYPEPRPPA